MDENQQSLLEQVLSIIESSSLDEEDKKLLTERVPFLSVEVQETLVKIHQEDPEFLGMMVENLKLKLDAQDNPDKIAEIVEKERAELTRIMSEE